MHYPANTPLPTNLWDDFSRLDTHSTSGQSSSKHCFRDILTGRSFLLDRRIMAVYKKLHDGGGHDLRTQYLRCRTDAWVVQNRVTQELRVASRRCNQRWCPMCAKTKRWVITNSVADWVTQAKFPKFLTLTLKSSDASLELQVSRLYDAFKALRKRPFWRRKVKGGIWFFQLTMSKATRLWHPHIHILVDGEYIPKRQLRDEWLKQTFDSFIVDIRKVEDPEKAAEYVARYATMPGDLLSCTVSQGAAMVVGLRGRRMCGAFGSAKGVSLRAQSDGEHNLWSKVMSYTAMSLGALLDPYIALIKKALDQGKPFAADVYGLYDTPDMPPDSLRYKPESAQQLLFEACDCYFISGWFQ